jgi:hypothetical protein
MKKSILVNSLVIWALVLSVNSTYAKDLQPQEYEAGVISDPQEPVVGLDSIETEALYSETVRGVKIRITIPGDPVADGNNWWVLCMNTGKWTFAGTESSANEMMKTCDGFHKWERSPIE